MEDMIVALIWWYPITSIQTIFVTYSDMLACLMRVIQGDSGIILIQWSALPNYPPLTIKVKSSMHSQMLKINFLWNLSVCFISTSETIVQIQKCVVLRMLSSYSSCNTHLIMRSFVTYTYCSSTLLDPTVT